MIDIQIQELQNIISEKEALWRELIQQKTAVSNAKCSYIDGEILELKRQLEHKIFLKNRNN